MAQLHNAFDASGINPLAGLGGLPEGKHLVVITESEIKPTKDKRNELLELTLESVYGESKGQKGAYRLNLYHKNELAQEIAKKNLARICHAVGIMQLTDTAQLHGRQFGVAVDYQAEDDSRTDVVAIMNDKGIDMATGKPYVKYNRPKKATVAPAPDKVDEGPNEAFAQALADARKSPAPAPDPAPEDGPNWGPGTSDSSENVPW